MKKRLVGLVILTCLTISGLLGCAINKEDIQGTTQVEGKLNDNNLDKVYTMQIAHAQSIDSPRHILLEALKKSIEEETKGGIIVEIYPAAQLGSEKEMLEETCAGVIQSFCGGQYDILPKLSLFTLPFLCDSEEEIKGLLSSDFAKDICGDSEKHGVIILGIGDAGGFRQFSNNKKMIREPDDLVGLKISSNGLDTTERTITALGATPVMVPYGELYNELEDELIDGQENPWVNVSGMRVYEVQKYFTEINYQFYPDPFYVNLEWYNKLPQEYQQIVQDSVDDMMEGNYKEIVESQNAALEVIKNHSQVYHLTDQERQVFKDAVDDIYNEYIDEGLMTQVELDIMRDIIKGPY